jgi:PilZ domain
MSSMAVAQRSPSLRALSEDRRRHQRVKVNLLGRYMFADRREFPCQVVNMSPGGMALIAPVGGKPGERVIAYVDHLGRLEGQIARIFENGFAMTISATARKRDKLAAQLTWLANRHILALPEDRRHGRIVPRNPVGRVILANGVNLTCRIIDVSQSGAGISSKERPPIGSLITLGKVQGRVVRHLEDGFAVEFTRLQHPDFLEENVTGG